MAAATCTISRSVWAPWGCSATGDPRLPGRGGGSRRRFHLQALAQAADLVVPRAEPPLDDLRPRLEGEGLEGAIGGAPLLEGDHGDDPVLEEALETRQGGGVGQLPERAQGPAAQRSA